MAYSSLKANPDTQRAWQERSRQRAIAKAREKPKVALKPGGALQSTGTLKRTGPLPKQSAQAKSDARELAKIKAEMLAEDPGCRRCRREVPLELHHKGGRVGWRMLHRPWLVLLCADVCHPLCKSQPAQMMAEGWIVSRFKQREEL